jgi:hypothetical protein
MSKVASTAVAGAGIKSMGTLGGAFKKKPTFVK